MPVSPNVSSLLRSRYRKKHRMKKSEAALSFSCSYHIDSTSVYLSFYMSIKIYLFTYLFICLFSFYLSITLSLSVISCLYLLLNTHTQSQWTHLPTHTYAFKYSNVTYWIILGPTLSLTANYGLWRNGNSLRILFDDLPLPQQSSTSGIYKELGDLRHKNRMAFIKSKDRGTAIDTLVREGHHSLYDVDFSLANLISDDFSIMGRLISEVVE